jgi:polysaccharide export outer membrane protein
VLGEVQKPCTLPLSPGMTLLTAISSAGGFNAMAWKTHVNLRRRVGAGVELFTLDAERIMRSQGTDPKLQAGDAIEVEQTPM